MRAESRGGKEMETKEEVAQGVDKQGEIQVQRI